jgi:DNA mismatch endonuclease (patch repair protein)
MSRIRSRNTKPELAVRRLAHSLGYRYRLHKKDLPGSPDLVFPNRRAVIFVHGCFWHAHAGCGRTPKSRLSYWLPKLKRNRIRDKQNMKALTRDGWSVLVIWECEVTDKKLSQRIIRFLDAPRRHLR